MTRIILVEERDELQDQVGSALDRWEVHYASGSNEALELMESLGGSDVLITDTEMAEMDGAQLLGIVRDRFPATARLVIARRAPRDVLVRTVGPAHQYLPTPVDVDELVEVIEHIFGASTASLRDPIRSLIGQADRLPSPPDVFQNLMQMIAVDDWTVDGVTELIGRDVALTAEMMKLVNSSFFGFFGEITSVERAISLLGVDLVRSIVLGSELFATDAAMQSWLDLGRLDSRSKSVANCARVLAMRHRASSETAGAAHLAGMVAEVGMLVMARIPDVDELGAAALNDAHVPEVERLLFGGDRFEVGSQLLRLWGFSESIVDAVSALSAETFGPPDGLEWCLSAARRLVIVEGLDETSFALSPGDSPEFDHAVALLVECSSVDA